MNLKMLAEKIRKCKSCRLSRTRKKAVPGEGSINAEIMLVGQAPGRKEDETGRPFVGRSGKFLDFLLEKNNIKRKDVFITSAVKCFPPKNRKPKPDEIIACEHYLVEQIRRVDPKTIVLLGSVAKAFMERNKNLAKTRRIIATVHPAAGMRFPSSRKKIMEAFRKI